MIAKLFTSIIRISPKVQKVLWKWWYQRLAKRSAGIDWVFMNYGYTPLNGSPKLYLEEKDEKDRLFIQLYHYAAASVPIENKSVLEVG